MVGLSGCGSGGFFAFRFDCERLGSRFCASLGVGFDFGGSPRGVINVEVYAKPCGFKVLGGCDNAVLLEVFISGMRNVPDTNGTPPAPAVAFEDDISSIAFYRAFNQRAFGVSMGDY